MIPRNSEISKPPDLNARAKQERFLKTLLMHLESLEAEAKSIMTEAADENNRVIIMAFNQGATDLFLNFLCSARRAGIPVNNVVVFAGDEVSTSGGYHKEDGDSAVVDAKNLKTPLMVPMIVLASDDVAW
jgi:hypothetical protein